MPESVSPPAPEKIISGDLGDAACYFADVCHRPVDGEGLEYCQEMDIRAEADPDPDKLPRLVPEHCQYGRRCNVLAGNVIIRFQESEEDAGRSRKQHRRGSVSANVAKPASSGGEQIANVKGELL